MLHHLRRTLLLTSPPLVATALLASLVTVPAAPAGAETKPIPTAPAASGTVVPTATSSVPLVPARSAARSRAAALGATSEAAAAPTLLTGVLEVGAFDLAAVTWQDPSTDPAAVRVSLRLRESGAWSGWQALDAGEAGDASAAAGTATAGTEPLVTDGADAAQVQVVTDDGSLPTGLALVTVDGGTAAPALRLAASGSGTAAAGTTGTTSTTTGTTTSATAGTTTSAAQPAIITRAQWGADESLRSGSTSTTSRVEAVTIHHTASTNSYTATDAAAQLRAVYAYHTRSLGWSDIGYNFIVDRFGRVYEGRAGSITSAVTGAHAGGFNTSTMGISALGNYETAAAPDALVQAMGRVAGWKLSQYGVDPAGEVTLTSAGGGTSRYAAGASVTLPRVFAHRQVGATACPGANLYARMATVRAVADATAGAATPPPVAPPEAPPAPVAPAPAQVFGPGASVVVGDLDGNGRDEMGWFRDGRWAMRTYSGSVVRFAFGRRGDVPVLGDWDRDGKDEPGVFRAGRWFWRDSATTGAAALVFDYGRAGDVPVLGRWGGQYQDGLAVVRDGTWYARWTIAPGPSQHNFAYGGGAGSVPVLGSWLSDRVARPGSVSAATWRLSTSIVRPADAFVIGFGRPTDTFRAVDWDGDGIQQPVAVRGDTFYLRRSLTDPSAVAITFGG